MDDVREWTSVVVCMGLIFALYGFIFLDYKIGMHGCCDWCEPYTVQHPKTALSPPERGHQLLLVILLTQVVHTLFHWEGETERYRD